MEIPVCVGYEVDGEVIRDFPTTNKLERAKPVLKVLPGWKTDIRGIKKYEDLPENCRKYIEFVEKELEVPIKIVSKRSFKRRYYIEIIKMNPRGNLLWTHLKSN